MLKIVIQNPSNKTVINNVFPEELDFWKNLLQGSPCGEVSILEQSSNLESCGVQNV